MQATLDLAPLVLERLAAPSPEATKAVAELAMAADFLGQVHGPVPPLCALAQRLAARLADDAHLALLGHPFLIGQALTPYVFLRRLGVTLPPWERVLRDWAVARPVLREATPYRRMEVAYLRAKCGLQPLPGWQGAAILRDARRAWAFNRELSYAFTHVVLFATDFAAIRRPDPFVRGVGRMLLAEALERSDVDLVWELALCLLTQDLAPQDLAEVVGAAAAMRAGFGGLTDPAGVAVTYHPVLVHDILAARLWQHHGIDLAAAPAADLPGLAALEVFRRALAGKDAAAMVAAHAALPLEPWAQAMLRDRLAEVRRSSRARTLFLRETGGAEIQGDLYPDYARRIGALIRACA
ncbi:MAG: hypothetical protein KBF78_02005 [Fuscovulum sp.]|nr:hypothetical protein [Fuscovulum sp.]